MTGILTPERLTRGAFLLMESFVWFVVASVLAAGAGGRGPAYVTVLLGVLGGFAMAWLLLRFDLPPVPLGLAGAAATVLALTLLLNLQYNPAGNPLSFSWFSGFVESPDGYLTTRWPQTWGVLLVAGAWLRSAYLAGREMTYGLAVASFSVGMLIFVATLIFGQGASTQDRINYSALPFFVCGLLALSLTHLLRGRGVETDVARGPWLSIVAGTVALIALLGATLGFFPLGLFNRLLQPVGRLALLILDLIIYAIALPIGWLATIILQRLVSEDTEWPIRRDTASRAAEETQQRGDQSGFVAFLLTIVQFLFVLAVLALVAYVIWRIFRYLRRPPKATDEIRETVEDAGGIGDDLNALLQGLLGRFRRAGGRTAEPDLPPGARRVRRLYLDLLDDAETRGTVRPPPATPGEFAPALRDAYANQTPDRLSDRFAAARYGRVEPGPEEVQALERGVEEMKRAGRN